MTPPARPRPALSRSKRLAFIGALGLLLVPLGYVAETSYRMSRGIPLVVRPAPSERTEPSADVPDFQDVHYYEIFEPTDDPLLPYVPRPGFARGRIRINSLGFRDREVTREKPPGTFRIVVLGDSIVWGHRLPLEETFAKQLEGLLRAESPGDVEVLNLGVSGYSAVEQVAFFLARGVPLDPDLVIVGFCVNDHYHSSVEGDFLKESQARLFGKSYLWDYVQLALGEWLRTRVGWVPDVLSRSVDVRGSLARLAEATPGQRHLVAIFPVLRNFDAYKDGESHAILREAAAGGPFEVVDLLDAFRAAPEAALRVEPRDYVHPNRLGNEIAARAVHRELRARGLLPAVPPDAPSAGGG